MINFFRKALVASPVAFAATLAVAGGSFAAETAAPVSVDALTDSVELAQVTSVSELSDVLPSDWAYTALQRLVEEYGCIEGYPDRTFRGNRAMTRYEFAAGLNACLDVIVQLIGPDGSSELDTIRRLQEEFAGELATLRGRVDTLEADVAELEANQFSTTTKLRGQVDAHLVIPFDAPTASEEVSFNYRARLNFDTSFTGEDRLRIRFQASDRLGSPVGAVPGGLQNASGVGPNATFEDNIALDDVFYKFPVGERLSVTLAANSIWGNDFVSSSIVPFDDKSVGDFGEPQLYDVFRAADSFGVGVNFELTENLILDLGYSTANGNDPSIGLFDDNAYIAQLNYLTDGLIDAAITYVDGDASLNANIEYVLAGLLNLDFGRFQVGGYYAFAEEATGGNATDSWQAGISVPNFIGKDRTFGAYVGQDFDDDITAEGYYDMKINKFFSITPAILYVDPNGADSEFYGVVRTTIRF
jgi:Carbohydrate-selective porin, OprB family/S-layer homology domain